MRETRAKLDQVRRHYQHMLTYSRQLAQLRDVRLQGVRYGQGRGPSVTSTVERLVERIDEAEGRLVEAIGDYVDAREWAEVRIAPLPDPDRLVMQLRYLECLSWEDVAERMHYDVRHVYRIHNRALRRMSCNVTSDHGIL